MAKFQRPLLQDQQLRMLAGTSRRLDATESDSLADPAGRDRQPTGVDARIRSTSQKNIALRPDRLRQIMLAQRRQQLALDGAAHGGEPNGFSS
jgi:hypothetical protein